MLDIDGWAIWGTKAKVLYYEPLHPTPAYFHDLSLSYSHLDYPLIVPMLWTGQMVASGNVDDPTNKAVVLIPLLGAMLLLYAVAREGLTPARAALIVSLFAGAPAMSRWSGQGQADMVIAAFILAATIWFMRWIRDRHPRNAIATGFFIAIAASTKLEGKVLYFSILGYAILSMLWTLIFNRSVKPTIGGIVLILVSALLIMWSVAALESRSATYTRRLRLSNICLNNSRWTAAHVAID
ncbi:MAG TPA: glycosyltransferase family 39 protein [Tepidisphaeraceae bacterium]|nr:glycosyltransferase family 39 protein [Tepidisphaeraceae bacterium]